MSMRIFSAAAWALLSACGSEPTKSEAEGERIACALDGAETFTQACSVEFGQGTMTVRRDDGGFRRFGADCAGNIDPADGADKLDVIRNADKSVELDIGDDRYRLKEEIPADAVCR